MNINEWMKSGKYLPEPLRDFHDQKEVFKSIHEIVSQNDATKGITWIQAHCYVIDVFLWFMARRGWTLQRSRAKHDFADLDETLDGQRAKRLSMLHTALFDGDSK